MRTPLVLVLALVASVGRPAFAASPSVPCAGAIQEQGEVAPAPADEPLVRAIVVRGNARYTSEQLVAALGLAVDQPFDRGLANRGLELLWSTFRVRGEVATRPATDGGVDVLLTVVEMPVDFEPRFLGNVEIAEETLREWAGLTEGGELYLHQAALVRERIELGYLQEGFHFVEVRVVERVPEPGAVTPAVPDVIFEIREGPEVKVADVVVHGNESFPDRGWSIFRRGLRKFADTELRGPRFFGLFGKDFVEETLHADLLAMRNVYRERGFLDAIVELDHLDFDEEHDDVTIHISVDEGPRYVVSSLSIEGVEFYSDLSDPLAVLEREVELDLPEAELLALCTLTPGEFFEQRFVDQDLFELRRRYGEIGRIAHPSLPAIERWQFLAPAAVVHEGEPKVDIVYRIAQGREQYVREVRVVGNTHTQDRVIRRLVTVEPGDLANLDEILRSRSRIEGTGFFSDARNPLEHRPPSFRFVETGDPNWKDVEFEVQEGEVLRFNVSGGLSTNTGAFGLVELSHQNFDISDPPESFGSLIDEIAGREAFHGAGQEFRIQASPGTQVSYFDVYFREPDILRRHKDRISLSLNARKRLRLYDSHDEEREELGVQLGRQVGPDSAVFVGFTSGEVDIDDLDPGGETTLGSPLTVPRLLKEQEGESDLARIDFGFRMRTVDNRLSPRHGINFVASTGWYSKGLGSDYDFVTLDTRFDWYEDIGDNDEVALPRVHLGLRGAVGTPLGSDENVPYSERFFLGGQRTLRGFDFRGVGPNENRFPIGGETLLYGTAEIRFPLVTNVQPGTYREIEMVHGGFFVDVGVLDPGDWQVDWNETRASVGILFGLSVPLPITISLGWPVRDGPEDRRRVVGFNIGI